MQTYTELTTVDVNDDENFAIVNDGRARRTKMGANKCSYIIVVFVVAACGLGLGVVIGWFSKPASTSGLSQDADSTVSQKLFDKINTANIRQTLREFTSYTHLAGTPGDERQAQSIEQEWTRQGLTVMRSTYDVLLSYPNFTHPSFVQLLDGSGSNASILYQTAATEDVLTPEQNVSDAIPPFNAYSPSGDVWGELVYVNYASVDDFELLQKNYSIDFSNKIVIAKFGEVYRGDKVKWAAEFGAIGIILYMDPLDFAPDPTQKVFPDSWWLPGSGTQRGTTLLGDADPLTPNYPSTATAYRISETNNTFLPRIPVHPIGYADAYHLLKNMAGPEVPTGWQGGLNFTYHIGPGHQGNSTTRLRVTTYNNRVNISNVFGVINGSVEPDRYVLLGVHRDAWVFGGVDPTSSTALMMELSRVTMEIVKEGWKPRRSIVFVSWGAEEYGCTGSFEWVEEFVKILGSRAVAYLNVDYVMDGNMSLYAGAMPTMNEFVMNAAKVVKSPHSNSRSLYDDWIETFPAKDADDKPTGFPQIDTLGDSSDFAGFVISAGIPCYDVWFSHNTSVPGYPLYHTIYEGFTLYDKILDPEYKIAKVVGQFWGETMRQLADVLVLPLNVSTYATLLFGYATQLQKGYGDMMQTHGISLDPLYSSLASFKLAADSFHRRLADIDQTNPLTVRAYNDQLMLVDRAFIDPLGLPLRPVFRHVIYAPSVFNAYAGSTFPGLSDLMYKIDEQPDPTAQWEQVKQHYATIIYCIDSAAAILRPVETFIVRS